MKSCFSATDRTLESSRPLESRTTDRTLPASGHLPPDASGRKFAALEPLCTRSDAAVLRPVGLLPVSGLAFGRCCCCRASWLERPNVFLQRPVQRPVTFVSSFLRDLAYGLVPIFVLGLCLISWVFSCAPKVLLEVLIIGSSRRLCPSHVLHPIELQKQSLANSLVQFGCVGHQAPKSKVNGPRVYFPYNPRRVSLAFCRKFPTKISFKSAQL